MKRPYADFAAGVRKQATVPEGSTCLGLAGTAPGLVVEAAGTPVIVLPGPPAELQRLWPSALETEAVRRVLDRGTPPLRRTLRFFGPGESQVAQAFQEAGGEGDGCRGDDLRAQLRGARRPRRGAERRGAAARARVGRWRSGSAASSTPRTAAPSRSSSSTAAANAAGRSRRPSRAPAGSSPRGSRRSPAPRT